MCACVCVCVCESVCACVCVCVCVYVCVPHRYTRRLRQQLSEAPGVVGMFGREGLSRFGSFTCACMSMCAGVQVCVYNFFVNLHMLKGVRAHPLV